MATLQATLTAALVSDLARCLRDAGGIEASSFQISYVVSAQEPEQCILELNTYYFVFLFKHSYIFVCSPLSRGVQVHLLSLFCYLSCYLVVATVCRQSSLTIYVQRLLDVCARPNRHVFYDKCASLEVL